MPLGLLGLLDVSVVTDRLLAILRQARDTSALWTVANPQFTIVVSGSAPDSVRDAGNCQLSLYLFHISQDKFQRNSPVTPPRFPLPDDPFAQTQVPRIPFQPLSLDLFYLLTAFAGNDYVHEQQAMSIGLKCFHENPIIRSPVKIGVDTVPEEFTLTMEIETADELGRLWQAVSAPARLSMVYKVSVVFITPESPATGIAPPVKVFSVEADPATLAFAESGAVIGTSRRVSYRAADATDRSFDQSPATVAAGERVFLLGAGLGLASSNRVFLLTADGSSQFEVTAWRVTNPVPPAAIETNSRFVLELPATVGPLPAALPPPGAALTETPPAGVYQLCVGDGVKLSNSTPLSIAAKLTTPPGPSSIISEAAGVFSINGVGFISGRTELLIGTVKLDEALGAPAVGEFDVSAAGDVMTFKLPPNLPSGIHAVRVRVNGIESAPTWWVQIL